MGDRRLGERWGLRQRAKNDLIYASAVLALGLTHALPHGSLAPVGKALGLAAALLFPAMRRQAAQRLARAFGDRAPVTVWQVFAGLGGDAGDMARLLHTREPADATMKIEREAELCIREAHAQGRGVVFATAHLGSIERMAALVASLGLPVATVARESYDPRFQRLYDRLRAHRGVEVIYRGRPGATARLARTLRAGSVVGFPMDFAGRGVLTHACPFLGDLAPIPVGPARLALQLACPVLVGTPALGAMSGTVVQVESVTVREMVAHPRADQMLTQLLAQRLEDRIRRMPAHWPWMWRPGGAHTDLPSRGVCR